MSLPEERPSFKEPSSPIGRVQLGLAESFLFESGNNEQANLLNNNINKGKWTEEEHVAEQQKQRQSLSPENKTQMLCNDAAAHKKQRQSLSPDDKVHILMNNAAAHKKQ